MEEFLKSINKLKVLEGITEAELTVDDLAGFDLEDAPDVAEEVGCSKLIAKALIRSAKEYVAAGAEKDDAAATPEHPTAEMDKNSPFPEGTSLKAKKVLRRVREFHYGDGTVGRLLKSTGKEWKLIYPEADMLKWFNKPESDEERKTFLYLWFGQDGAGGEQLGTRQGNAWFHFIQALEMAVGFFKPRKYIFKKEDMDKVLARLDTIELRHVKIPWDEETKSRIHDRKQYPITIEGKRLVFTRHETLVPWKEMNHPDVNDMHWYLTDVLLLEREGQIITLRQQVMCNYVDYVVLNLKNQYSIASKVKNLLGRPMEFEVPWADLLFWGFQTNTDYNKWRCFADQWCGGERIQPGTKRIPPVFSVFYDELAKFCRDEDFKEAFSQLDAVHFTFEKKEKGQKDTSQVASRNTWRENVQFKVNGKFFHIHYSMALKKNSDHLRTPGEVGEWARDWENLF